MSTANLDLLIISTQYFIIDSLNDVPKWMELSFLGHLPSLYKLSVLAFIALCLIHVLLCFSAYDDGLPIVNRRAILEPRVFARIRWAKRSRDILEAANEKASCIRDYPMSCC